MANPVTNPAPQGYWGVIQASAAARENTAQLWARIGAFEQAQGLTRPTGLFLAVSAMRSLAVTQRVAASVFSKAGGDAALTSAMIAPAVNARPLGDQALAPWHVVRYEVNTLTDAGASTQWLTMMFRGNLPATKGELIDQITAAGLDSATGYGSVFTGLTGQISITAR